MGQNQKKPTVPDNDNYLDKIFAELGEGPPILEPSPLQVEESPEEETKESAAARKKRKKKDKEKEKKAATVSELNDEKKMDDVKKLPEKKVLKHVRYMQEALARRNQRKMIEEERLRKEQEEWLRQEELQKQAEEAKRMKKQREKEKILLKKKEGKLLTGKQKTEKLRLEAIRNQFLSSARGLPPITSPPSRPAKRPKYQTKKTRPGHRQANGSPQAEPVKHVQEKDLAHIKSLESEKMEAMESMLVEEKSYVTEAIEEDEDKDQWDANNRDDSVLNLSLISSFADEEVISELDIGLKNDRTNTASILPAEAKGPYPTRPARKTLPSQPVKSSDIESKKQDEVEVVDKDGRKQDAVKKKAPTPDATPKQEENLRSPICCIMGHVDAGKTKLLDCIRGTNVQEGEAGGITQQIGATYFPAENILERTRKLKASAMLKVPGLVVIDTPGHESFANLRSRGSSLCDIAILVVDIMHGLEPQTIESLNLLKMRNTEFIVALNKVDRLYGWKKKRNAPLRKTWKQQSKDVQEEFNTRLSQIITQFKEQGVNTDLYWNRNKITGEGLETFYIFPTSAISGEGIPDLLLFLVLWAQKTMSKKLMYRDEVQCTVLEVKVVEGHGTTIDVILVNGMLHEGDQIVVCGMQGPIVTSIRALLTPHPMKELRVKGAYLHHKEIKAAQGIKIAGKGLEHAISGTGLYVVGPEDDLDCIKASVMDDMNSILCRIDKSGEGVCIQASTVGSLEALLEFLKSPAVNIPVSGIGIGPVHRKDVLKAHVMLDRKKKKYAVILAFDVKVTEIAKKLARKGVKIFTADVIYHLVDQYMAYIHDLKEREKEKEVAKRKVVFPCVLKILPNCIFNKKDPIVLGVDVIEGIAKVGTPLCFLQSEFIDIGRIASIENNHNPVDYAKKGQKIAIKIVGNSLEEQQKMYGRHFNLDDELVSHISRESVDIIESTYRDDLCVDEWRLLEKLKILFEIE